jgi:hypothetical protein
MSKHLMTAGITMALLIGLTGCSDFRRAVGKEKSSPDEFEVVVRPPLSLPPGFSDRPEDIIAADKTASGVDAETTAESVLAVGSVAAGDFEQLFDFSDVPDDIRAKVDAETYGIQIENRLPLQQLFGGLPDVGPVLDKMSEDTRLRKARLEGRLPTDDATLATDPLSDQPLAVQ